jgi:mono/diheme cytochrome c family protein
VIAISCLPAAGAPSVTSDPTPTFRQYCFGCHGKAAKMAGVSLEQLTSRRAIGEDFQHWEKVASALEKKLMPPKPMPQPSDVQREQAVTWIRARLNEYIEKHAGDPGRVTMRRLTSAEYAYTIRDLTGLDLKFDRDFVTDMVGGEGFTNFGDVQFMEDANLERYLEAARTIATHAVIGSGPISFFEHPGQSGFELSAVNRIQEIYRANGFRAVAGEGAKPYGLDRYGKAFFATWQFRHREALGQPAATLEQIAAREGISARFIRHIWSIVNQPAPRYPISDVVAKWRAIPAPTGSEMAAARKACTELQTFVIDWPRWLFAAGPMESAVGDDRVFLLTDETLKANTKDTLRLLLRGRGQKTVRVYLSVPSMNPGAASRPIVTWRNGAVRVLRRGDRTQEPASQPLAEAEFSIAAGGTRAIDVPMAQGAFGVEVRFDVEVSPAEVGDAVVRPTMSDREEIGKGRTISALLANGASPAYDAWKAGVLEFAAKMPQNSHGEPTPSDRDPIPAPFDNTYNKPERNHYHIKVKYYRTDGFLVENVLDDATRRRLDQAWNDVYSSFDYHDEFLRFLATKYQLDLKKKGIADLDEAQIAAMPPEPRQYVKALRAEYDAVMKTERAARTGHVEDCVRFAAAAWRRPLSKAEEDGLRAFYRRTRTAGDHPTAVRALLARILVAPAFLYRLEQPPMVATDRALSNWELANRLSYFLWSSIPDDELRRAARAGELTDPQQLERQAKRMVADPKARRMATEFFGQWLGFYRFDQHRGVDPARYPEFTDEVKSAMYDEAVSFFEHIVRKNRPVREILSADYTFLNQALAKHYGVKKEIRSQAAEKVDGATAFNRGGVLRLGAVLTATSAPLRTSPVKRGDWVLRRILGTPTPPPPADAGSIPADEKHFGGLTLFERLEVHKRNPSCASCHVRIDPLGFPLERFDALGRWRDKYSDGKPVHDSSTLADKTPIVGVDGLLDYLKTQERQVLRSMSSKLLGYALGRTILASDQPLIESMTKAGGDATLSQLAAQIVASRQFRYRREREDSPPRPPQQQHVSQRSSSSNKEGGL